MRIKRLSRLALSGVAFFVALAAVLVIGLSVSRIVQAWSWTTLASSNATRMGTVLSLIGLEGILLAAAGAWVVWLVRFGIGNARARS